MLLKLKPHFKATFETEGKVAITPNSALRLFAPGDPFLMDRYELEPEHWHVAITEEYINEGELAERVTKGLVTFFKSKDDAVKTMTTTGVDLQPSLMQSISLRWQGRTAPMEILPPR